MPTASRISVTATKGANYFIDFHPRSVVFRSMTIEGLGSRPVEIGAEGGTVSPPDASLVGSPSTLSYRFQLHPALQPGVYDWPLPLAVPARYRGACAPVPDLRQRKIWRSVDRRCQFTIWEPGLPH